MSLLELLQEVDLEIPVHALPQLERLVDELLHWTRRRNLTAITEHDEVLDKHLIDSLTLLPFAARAKRLLDLGSGAGFPSLPLKIVCPELDVVSVDAVGKKIDFQKHIVRTLGLQDFTATHSRIEDLSLSKGFRGGFDLITARALCSLNELVVLSEPFVAPGGRLLAMKGPEGEQELSEQQDWFERNGWTVLLHRTVLPLSRSERCLIELKKQDVLHHM